MKLTSAIACLGLLTCAAASRASTAIHADPLLGGIGYYWTVTLGQSDSASVSHFVGAWSWEDSSLFGSGETPVGWTHNSDWVALKIDAPSIVTIRYEKQTGVSLQNPFNPDAVAAGNLVPGMTLYSGWDNDLAPQSFADANNSGEPTDNWHSYSNRGDIVWAEDTKYIVHGQAQGKSYVEITMRMEIGEYSIALGGNGSSGDDTARQGYLTTFTSVPVPEPSSGLLLAAGTLALALRRRPRAL